MKESIRAPMFSFFWIAPILTKGCGWIFVLQLYLEECWRSWLYSPYALIFLFFNWSLPVNTATKLITLLIKVVTPIIALEWKLNVILHLK